MIRIKVVTTSGDLADLNVGSITSINDVPYLSTEKLEENSFQENFSDLCNRITNIENTLTALLEVLSELIKEKV